MNIDHHIVTKKCFLSVLVIKISLQEPEITDLARFLTNTGACVEGAGTDKICIRGKSRLLGTEHTIMPDRIEAGTFMLAAAITRSCISLSPVYPGCLSSLIDKLSESGCTITHKNDKLEVYVIIYICCKNSVR